jgi:N-methylhydantoinase A/oxoprolinase/acetone carboxylase beta subunit
MNRIDPGFFFGGEKRLNRDKALRVIKEKIADPLKLDVFDAAEGICKIADSAMEALLKQTMAAKGITPKDYTLVAFGGAGPLHCAGYSAKLGFRKVIIPSCSAVFSAFGASTSDVTHRYETSPLISIPNLPYDSVSLRFKLDQIELGNMSAKDIEKFNDMSEQIEERAYRELAEEGFTKDQVKLQYEFLGRYGGQLWEISCFSPVSNLETNEDLRSIIKIFEEKYSSTYTKGAMVPAGGMEIVSIALTASGPTAKPVLPKREYAGKDPSEAIKSERSAYYKGRWSTMTVYDMDRLRTGNVVDGPAIIEAKDTTVFVPIEHRISVDEYQNFVMEML